MNKITGTIITLNAEKYIERAIKSLQSICDEVIVLDSESTDSTRDIAVKSGAKVFTQSFLKGVCAQNPYESEGIH